MSKQSKKHQTISKYMVLAGLVLVIAVIIATKSYPQTDAALLPEDQLNKALVNGDPALVFFHSTTCDPCMEMIENVERAYPEFSEKITLIDVNVSDERNHNLLRSQGVQLIPSLKFFDKNGQAHIVYGVITPEQIQEELITLLEQ